MSARNTLLKHEIAATRGVRSFVNRSSFLFGGQVTLCQIKYFGELRRVSNDLIRQTQDLTSRTAALMAALSMLVGRHGRVTAPGQDNSWETNLLNGGLPSGCCARITRQLGVFAKGSCSGPSFQRCRTHRSLERW